MIAVAIVAVVGGVTAAITEVASLPALIVGTFVTGFIGDVSSQMILEHKSFEDVNLITATSAGITNSALAIIDKDLSKIDKMSGMSASESIIFGTITNSPLIGLGMAINMGVSKNASVYTFKDLYEDTVGKIRELIESW